MDAFHSPTALIRPLCPARQKCFLSSLLHTLFLLKSYYFIVLDTRRELQNRKSLSFPGANYTLSSFKWPQEQKTLQAVRGYRRQGRLHSASRKSFMLHLEIKTFFKYTEGSSLSLVTKLEGPSQ